MSNEVESIAVSVFVVILVEFDKYWQSDANPNITDGETSTACLQWRLDSQLKAMNTGTTFNARV